MTRLSILFPLLYFCVALSAQSINFSYFETPYEEITDSVSVNDGLVWQYDNYVIPIGFEWEITGKRIDSLYIDDCFLGFITDVSFYDDDADYSNVTGLMPGLIEYVDGAVADGLVAGEPGSRSPLSYKVEGSPGSRIFKFQAKNLAFADEIFVGLTQLSFCNFQVWIYEEDNSLEYRYGPREIYHPEIAYQLQYNAGVIISVIPSIDENRGALNDPAVFIVGDLSMPMATVTSINEELGRFQMDSLPPNGMVYRFSLEPSSTVEPSAISTEALTISPNPAASQIDIEGLSTTDVSRVQAVDMSGKVFDLEPTSSAIDVSFLPNGKYEILVTEQEGQIRKGSIIKL